MTTSTIEQPTISGNLSDLNIKKQPKGNLCLCHMTIKAPDGLVMLKDYKLEASEGDGTYAQVGKGKTTNPRWRIDTHPLWKKLSDNKRDIVNLRSRHTVSDSIEGQYLLSMSQAGEFLGEFMKLKERRLSLARLMQDLWEAEIIPSIREAIGDKHYDLHVHKKLPSPETLPSRFGVDYALYPLTPIKGDELTFESLNEYEAKKVIGELNVKARQSIMHRFQAVADTLFGETMDLCEQIAQGSMETGKRRGGALDEIFRVLDRVRNFKEWATPEMLKQIDTVYDTLNGVTIQQVNHNKDVQAAIRKAFTPLNQAVTKLHGKQHRLKRSLSV